MKTSWVCLALISALMLGVVVPVAATEPPGDITRDIIARAIEQLAATQFARREAASRSLVAAGRPVIAPLAAAIAAGDMEVASRGIDILRDLLGVPDADTAAAAEAALETLVERGSPTVRQLAGGVLDFHYAEQADQARERLEAAGAVLQERPLPEGETGLVVELSGTWRGGIDELRLLPRLPAVAWLSLQGVALDDDALAVLGRVRGVHRIDLFGTGVAAAAVTTLRERLPEVEIDVRQGGRLGVSSTVVNGPCEITHVQPGSAAERAGVQPGDVVVRVDGEPIAGFKELTAQVAGRGPGEPLVLSIVRPGDDGEPERVECRAVLDAW